MQLVGIGTILPDGRKVEKICNDCVIVDGSPVSFKEVELYYVG